MARFGVASFGRDPLAYQDSRLSGVPTVEGPRDPTVDDTNYPIQTIWRNSVTFAECILVGFTGGDAQWNCFTSGSGEVFSLETDDGNQVLPNGGVIDLEGSTVANGTHAIPIFTDGATANTAKIQVQVGAAITGAPADFNDAGIVSFDDTAFSVDANGYVTLAGGSGPAIDSINVDSNTGPGTDPVLPDGAGQITVSGAAVAAHSVPIETHSRAANAYNIEVQVGSDRTGAPGNTNDAGIVSFDDTAFSVDANGYVTLVGGAGPAVDSFTTDVAGPVAPTAGGVVDVTGTSVFSDGTVANTLTLNVQATANTFLLGAGAGTTATELGPLTDGELIIGSTGLAPVLGNITSTDGSVTVTNGAGTIDLAVAAADDAILTLTGDTGGALSPTAGNMNILGGPGVTVTGAGSTLTVNSVVYTDQGGSVSVTEDSGSFATAAVTLTLPASPANGERCEFIATSGVLTIQAAGTQVIHLAGDLSSAGGTATGTATGDALNLIYQSSTDDWWALSSMGVWVLA